MALAEGERGFLEPLVELREGRDEIVVTVDLPFVRKEDVSVYVTERYLEIEAKMSREITFERWSIMRRELSFNSYQRRLRLPAEVKPEEVRARFRGGLLTIHLPKKTARKRIQVE